MDLAAHKKHRSPHNFHSENNHKKMKSEGINDIANHLAGMKLGSQRDPLTAAAVTAFASSPSAALVSSASRTTQNCHSLDALLALGGENHGKEMEHTPLAAAV